MKILEINKLKKSFDGKTVIEDISLSVEEGEVVSIIGPSGSGKSTMLRCINRLATAKKSLSLIRTENRSIRQNPRSGKQNRNSALYSRISIFSRTSMY